MKLKNVWTYFVSNKVHAEFIKYTLVAALGWLWSFIIMWALLDYFKVDIHFWFIINVDSWKLAFGLGSLFGLVHNFLLNKLLGGLSKI